MSQNASLSRKLRLDTDIFQSSLNHELSSQTKSNNLFKPGEPVEFRQRRTDFSRFHPETEKPKKSNQCGKSCRTKTNSKTPLTYATKSHKVRMLLNLPESSEKLMKSFKSKLRSQVKKPIKEGLNSKIGGLELLDHFYNIFSINMRDMGSPVHSKRLMRHVLEEFPDSAKIVVVYKDNQPLACSMMAGFKDVLENPWASALREYSSLSPNMFLYWTMLEYATDNDFNCFDFGRSSPDRSTYKFKKQWGAKPMPLFWHYISLNGEPIGEEASEKSNFDKAIQCWQKLPLSVTKIVGPIVRKHIGL